MRYDLYILGKARDCDEIVIACCRHDCDAQEDVVTLLDAKEWAEYHEPLCAGDDPVPA